MTRKVPETIYVLIPTTPERAERLANCIASIKRSVCKNPIEIVTDVNNYEGCVKSILRMCDKVDGLALFLGDDTEVYPDTIQFVYDAYIKAFPERDGMCATTDVKKGYRNFNHPFAHTKTFKELTYPGYFHNFVDREWADQITERKKNLEVPEARIIHNHYTRNGNLLDKTYKVGQDTSARDGKLYYARRDRNFVNDLRDVTFVGITRYKEYPKEIDTSGFGEVLIQTESPNVYTRYLLARKAKNDIIYFQDDDAILDYRELFKHYNGTLTNGITTHHEDSYKGTGITLVGWGCFFPKWMIGSIQKYIDAYGEDFYLRREADRIFTYLNQPHNSIRMPHTDINQVERMSHEPGHYSYIPQVLKKLALIKK